MPENSKKSKVARTGVEYRPAQLHEGKAGREWYVWYYAREPRTDALKRKKIKINRIEPVAARRRYGRKLVDQINAKLEEGWSPWVEHEAGKGAHKLVEAVETFRRVKLRTIEPNSERSYRSLSGYFLRWLEGTGRSDMLAMAWSKEDTFAYLDHLARDRDLAARTYNNYLVFSRTLFNWLVERDYVMVNYFLKQRKLKVKRKGRKVIPEPILFKIREYLAVHDPGFLMVCYLLFYTEIRPGEQCGLRVRDINFARQVITVSGGISKNQDARFPTVPDVFLEFLRKLKIDQAPPNHFLISGNCLPGRVPTDARSLSRRWSRLRDQLGIPMKHQLYSLRDNGIVYMLDNGVPPNAVMIQAGHADLEMTTEYIDQWVDGPVDRIKTLGGGF